MKTINLVFLITVILLISGCGRVSLPASEITKNEI